MNRSCILFLKSLRKLYGKVFPAINNLPGGVEFDPEKASGIIYNALTSEKPCMISRLGATELAMLINYLSIQTQDRSIIRYVKGDTFDWWWNKNLMNQMRDWSGFFPPTESEITKFCELMLEELPLIDVLGSWLPSENKLQKQLQNAVKVRLPLLEPYTASDPWSRCLEGKRVLVIHPFAELIKQQYQSRANLFANQQVLPEFELQTIKAVQSLGGNSEFNGWFDALNWMKSEINNRDFDFCLIGAGAYGLPLAAHVKRYGKKSIHLAGALQLMFGIRGRRWEDPNYAIKWGLEKGLYANLFNEFWRKPGDELKPMNANEVENGCYW